jgi:hypothetical protein
MRAHFFDLNTAISVDSEVWIVSKTKPNQPILKINQSDFNIIQKGVFRRTGHPLVFSGKEYFLPEQLLDKLKINCKKYNVEITDLGFSMQEFMNPEIIDTLNYKIWKEHFINLKNSNDDIYMICSKNTKRNYEKLINKLEKFLEELGLKVKNYYYFSETFYNRDEEKIANSKIRLIIQHTLGLKTEGDKFIDKEISQYDEVFYYDDERVAIKLGKQSNTVLKFLYDNSGNEVKEKVSSILKDNSLKIIINETTYNKVNKFVGTTIELKLDKIIKTFESFKYKF